MLNPSGKYQWNAGDYAAHSSAQLKWTEELIAKLNLEGNEELIDIGCGDGKVSARIAASLPSGSVIDIDSSNEMIQGSQAAFPQDQYANLTFQQVDVRELSLENCFDVAFSNAAPILEMLDDLMQRPRWKSYFLNFPFPYGFHAPREYKQWLKRAGLHAERAELIPKDMLQQGHNGLAGWIRTTWLPYTGRVPEPLRDDFIADLVDGYIDQYPLDKKGCCHVPMVRLEVQGYKIK